MNIVESNIHIKLDEVNIESNFEINTKLYDNTITDIMCHKGLCDSVDIYAKITSDNKNKNYLIAEDFKQYIISLFSVFGVNVRIKSYKIDTDTDIMAGIWEIKPPVPLIKCDSVINQAEKMKRNFFDQQFSKIFYNLVEAQSQMDIMHRFRSLFAVFDYLSDKYQKNVNEYIDYIKLSKKFVEETIHRYIGNVKCYRYIDFVKEFRELDLKDEHKGVNYSEKLKESFDDLKKGEFINEEVAYNILKCIQIIRNMINHRIFGKLNNKSIAGAYELLLPLAQRLIVERSNLF